MAYLRFDDTDLSFSPSTSARSASIGTVLNAVEQQVVVLAMSEPLSSLNVARRPILEALIGHRPNRPLADPKLEALRRFVVLQRHGRAAHPQAVDGPGGYDLKPETMDYLRRKIAPMAPRKDKFALGPLVLLAVAIYGTASLAAYFDDILPAIVVTLTLIVPFVAMALSGSRRGGG